MRAGARPGSVLCAAALAGAAVLLWPNVPRAAAAQGTFTYTDTAGVSKTSANPPNGSCIPLAGSGQIVNRTDVPVGFYQTSNCKDRVAAVDKGDSGSVPQYASIMFSQANKPQPRATSRQDQHRDDDADRSGRGGTLGGLGGVLGN